VYKEQALDTYISMENAGTCCPDAVAANSSMQHLDAQELNLLFHHT
jgi:hypothetical protein